MPECGRRWKQMQTTSQPTDNSDNRGGNGLSMEGDDMPRTAKATTPPEDSPAPEPLTDEQLRQLYADPNDIIPAHTLDDLVQGMKRELSISGKDLLNR